MRQTTLSTLRTRVRQKADIENYADRHTDSDLNTYINTAWRKLYGKLSVAHLLKNVKTKVVAASGAPYYSLPTDFFAAYGVFEEYNDGEGGHRELSQSNPGRRPLGRPGSTGPALGYQLFEKSDSLKIQFNPQPDSGTYVIAYVPEPKTLVDTVSDAATQSTSMNGALAYDEWVVLEAAIQVLEKDDRLAGSPLPARLQIIEQEIKAAQAARDLLQSTHIRRTRRFGRRTAESTGAPTPLREWEWPW